MARRFFRRASGPRRLLEILGDHDTEFPVSKPKLIKDMQRFLETHRIL